MKQEEKNKNILKIKQLQEERVQTYKFFQQKFEDYLDTKFEKVYQYHCQNITKKFKEISENINEIEKEFKKEEEIKSIIRKLQNYERENLKLIIEIQYLKTNFKFKKNNDLLNESEFEFDRNLKEMNLKHTNLIKDINDIISELLQEEI
eukprot:gene10192-2611_t